MENCTKKILKKTTSEQFQLLCQQMKNHPELACNKQIFGGNKKKIEELWAEISAKLHGIGPPTRDAVEWKKVWLDLKGRTKKKIASNHQSIIPTGGGPFEFEALTPIEEMIDEVLNVKGSAIPPGTVHGLEDFDECGSSHLKSDSSGTQKYKKREADSTSDLLREQVNQQKKLIDKIGGFYDVLKENSEVAKKQAEATEKLATLAEKLLNYLTED